MFFLKKVVGTISTHSKKSGGVSNPQITLIPQKVHKQAHEQNKGQLTSDSKAFKGRFLLKKMWVNKNRCSFQIGRMSHPATRETGCELQLQFISHDPPKKLSWGVIFPQPTY